MNKSLKALFMASMLPVMMLMAAVTLTSCEGTLDDIFGEWSRPTNQQNNEPTKEELLSDLSSALEEGAIVTITYTIDGVEYTSTFKRVGEEYILQSITPAAGTRTFDENAKANLDGITDLTGNNGLHIVVNNAGSKVILDATVNTKTLKLVTNIASEGVELKAVSVNDQRAAVVNNETEILKVQVNASGGGSGDIENVQIPYTPGQTYNDMVAVKQANGGKYMQIDTNNQVCVTYNGRSGHLVTDEGGQLKNDDLVVAGGGTLRMDQFPPEFYVERSWDATNHKVVSNDKNADNFNMVTDAQAKITWKGGTYVVNQNVTINGNITISNNVNLILCDGCTLTVNGDVLQRGDVITIYGQAKGTGKLILTSGRIATRDFSDLVIHGGNIDISSSSGNIIFAFKMYGGKFSVKTSGGSSVFKTGEGNSMTIYGGELEAINDYRDAIIVGERTNPGTLTVYGGKVIAKALNPNNGQAIIGKFARGEGITDIVFSESDNGTEWTETAANTSSKRYFKAEKGVPAYVPTDEEISALYAKLGEEMNITADMVSEWNITTLVGDVKPYAEAVTEPYAKPLAEKICKEKNLTSGVVLFMGGDETNGYDFYVINGDSKSKTHLASTAAIPAAWEGLTLFYVKK